MTSAVTHFEIYGNDLDKLAEFYRQLFGWKIEKLAAIDYFQIQTGSPEAPGTRGGLLNRPILGPRSWVHYVSVDSIDQTIERIRSMGGKVVREKAAVPKIAWYAIVEDPEGNIFAIYENDPAAFPMPEPD
ncbi:MAG: VOC family protein [Candidatus Acidiferrales bacterium]